MAILSTAFLKPTAWSLAYLGILAIFEKYIKLIIRVYQLLQLWLKWSRFCSFLSWCGLLCVWLVIVWLFIPEAENARPFIHFGPSISTIGLRNFGELFSISYICFSLIRPEIMATLLWLSSSPPQPQPLFVGLRLL